MFILLLFLWQLHHNNYLMLYFSLFEVYNDVVHLYVYDRHNQKGSDLSISSTEIKHKKHFCFLTGDSVKLSR